MAHVEGQAHREGAPQPAETHELTSDEGQARWVATAGARLFDSMSARWRVQRAGEALLDAIAGGNLAQVRRLLPEADVHLAEALEAAAAASRPEVIRVLLNAAARGRVPESRRAVSVQRLHHDRLFAYAATARLASRTEDGEALLDRVAAVTLLQVQAAIAAEPSLLAARNWLGQTLLHVAAATGNERAVAALLTAGADPNAADVQGHAPLATLANRAPRSDRGPHDDGCAAAARLIAAGADPGARSGVEKQTPLHMAARRRNEALAALLLDHGAPIDAQTTRGESPLRRAVNLDHVAFAGFLVRRGADPQLPDRAGTTPFEAARSRAMREALGGLPPRVERALAGQRG